MRALLVDNYDSYTYNLYQLIAEVNGEEPLVILNDQVGIEELDGIIDRERIECIVVSPGPGTPASVRDAGINLDVFARYTDVPIFGVCFGFQCMCQVHGGAAVVRAPEPVHGMTSPVYHDGDRLFRGIPSGQNYKVVRYHSLCVDPETLDAGAVVPLAWTRSDPARSDDGSVVDEGARQKQTARRVMMAAKHVSYPHYGVQFHPESICTTYGHALLENFRDLAASWNATRGAWPEPATTSSRRTTHLAAVVEKLPGCLGGIRGGTARMVDELFASDGTRDVFFLDSATPERTRFSYMGGVGGPLWRRVSYVLHEGVASVGGTLTVADREGATVVAECASIFDWITERTSAFSTFDATLTSLPFEFWGGPVGYLGYELKCQTGGRKAHRAKHCDACFFVVDRFVCVDHHSGDVYVVAVHDAEADGKTDVDGRGTDALEAAAWVGEVAAACRRMHAGERQADPDTPRRSSTSSEPSSPLSPPPLSPPPLSPPPLSPPPSSPPPLSPPRRPPAHPRLSDFLERHPQAAYRAMVEQCQASLYAGDSYELCLTNMLATPRGDADPWSVYRRLRQCNPAPYAAFMDFSAVPSTVSSAKTSANETTDVSGPVVCCSSPERFLRGTRTGQLEAKPIKGTARRHPTDPVRDAKAARELLESEKDRAENLMIVDLLRNDLGRVAETGSVQVPGLMRLESFATVHQMVSTIVAQKKESIGVGEVIRAAFPGGSMTGAPKIRSMELLDALERGPRGVYSGSLGFASWSGAFDLNIVIRTAIFDEEEILVGAGGAIVVQSDPQAEYDEMKLKFETLRVDG